MDFQRDCLDPARKLRQAIRGSLYYLDDEFSHLGERFTQRSSDFTNAADLP
jgi:hypothetical protein